MSGTARGHFKMYQHVRHNLAVNFSLSVSNHGELQALSDREDGGRPVHPERRQEELWLLQGSSKLLPEGGAPQ